ncbi:MAG: bifunctional 2-methylcitrate synthase/citrate synthase [Deinococcota bacterium]
MAETVNVKKGLEGVVVDTTSISKVMPEINSLTYRGYKVQDLAEHCSFEEVVYLLWHGELPTQTELDNFTTQERNLRAIGDDLNQLIQMTSKDAHPMDVVRTAVSFIGANANPEGDGDNLNYATDLLAKLPTIVAADFRRRKGEAVIAPDPKLSLSENFFHMCFGEVPDAELVKAFDASLILYAEHSFNASTFTSRVITSTLADMYSAVTGAIGALKGALHGGANEQVMYLLQEVGGPDAATEWMHNALAEKRKVMGFGHRVYKQGDSRVPTMKHYALRIAEKTGNEALMQTAQALEDVMVSEKGIYPNLDFPTGPAYYMLGFDIPMFTPIFVMARISGWAAHIIEQAANNRIIRPLSEYVGEGERAVTPLASRG